MNPKQIISTCILGIAFTFTTSLLRGQDEKLVQLPEPIKTGGKPLMEALNERQSTREFDQKELSEQTLSNLLWAAFGINRPESGKRTAPSSMNEKEMDIYVAKRDGLFLYVPEKNALKKILEEDIRAATGKQDYVATAAINLVYVADYSRLKKPDDEERSTTAHTNTGFIAQNVYLYCASEGLGTVIRGYVDKVALAKAMNLREDQEVILSQSVGYPTRK